MKRVYEGACHAEGADGKTYSWAVRITVDIVGDRAHGPHIDDVRDFAEVCIGLNQGDAEWDEDNEMEQVQ